MTNPAKILRYALSAFLPLILAASLQSQTFPAFAPPSVTTSVPMDSGVSSAQVPNGLSNTALMSVWSNGSDLEYSVSTDGLNSAYSQKVFIFNGTEEQIDCIADENTCSATVAVFNGKIYIAFAQYPSQGLYVVEATPVAGNVSYTFQIVHTDSTSPMSTSPAMAVFNNHLIIVYGVNTSGLKNAYFSTSFDGTSWTPASEQYLGNAGIASGSRPGMAAFNGKLWMCLQQNNSNHNLFYTSSSDGIVWAPATEVSSLQMGGGGSMVVFNNQLVLATQQNNSNSELFIFSSPNGTSWTGQGYSGLLLGSYPALSLFNSDISLQYPSKNSNRYLESNLASH